MLAKLHNLKTYFNSGKELLVPMSELNLLGIITFGFVAEERLLSRLAVEDHSTPTSSNKQFAAAKAAEAE